VSVAQTQLESQRILGGRGHPLQDILQEQKNNLARTKQKFSVATGTKQIKTTPKFKKSTTRKRDKERTNKDLTSSKILD
jgi:hypothetical protein